MNAILIVIAFLAAFLPLALAGKNLIKNKKAAVIINIVSVFSLCILIFALSASSIVFAADEDAAADETAQTSPDVSTGAGLGMIAAALATGLSCVGGGIAVASSAAAAIGAISENPKVFGQALIFVALAEGVALYGLIISLQILAKL